jgi:hypothetical protein
VLRELSFSRRRLLSNNSRTGCCYTRTSSIHCYICHNSAHTAAHLGVRSPKVWLADTGSRYSSVLLATFCSQVRKGSFGEGRRARRRCYTDHYKDADVLHYIYLFFQPTKNEVKTETVLYIYPTGCVRTVFQKCIPISR